MTVVMAAQECWRLLSGRPLRAAENAGGRGGEAPSPPVLSSVFVLFKAGVMGAVRLAPTSLRTCGAAQRRARGALVHDRSFMARGRRETPELGGHALPRRRPVS